MTPAQKLIEACIAAGVQPCRDEICRTARAGTGKVYCQPCYDALKPAESYFLFIAYPPRKAWFDAGGDSLRDGVDPGAIAGFDEAREVAYFGYEVPEMNLDFEMLDKPTADRILIAWDAGRLAERNP